MSTLRPWGLRAAGLRPLEDSLWQTGIAFPPSRLLILPGAALGQLAACCCQSSCMTGTWVMYKRRLPSRGQADQEAWASSVEHPEQPQRQQSCRARKPRVSVSMPLNTSAASLLRQGWEPSLPVLTQHLLRASLATQNAGFKSRQIHFDFRQVKVLGVF